MSIQEKIRDIFARKTFSSHRRRVRRRVRRRLGGASLERLETRAMMTSTFGDFNGDGYDDMAVGVPGEGIGSLADAGAVNVIYSNYLAMSNSGDQIFHQPGAGYTGSGLLQGSAEAGEKFGTALAAGDFDGDGYEDLAIGVPGEDRGPIQDAGAVQILYGTSSGLSANRNSILHQDSLGIDDLAEQFDRFGSVLTSGDFNDDGFADLAIGVPHENVGAINNAGVTHILFGSSAGLHTALSPDSQLWHQDVSGIGSDAERYDNFSAALAAGDFDNDGVDDLAVGVSGEDIGDDIDAGAVNVLKGQSGVGLTSSGSLFLSQDSQSGSQRVANTSEDFDYFGSSLAVGDLNDDGNDDLAVGVPGEDWGSTRDVGAVNVLYGHATELITITGDQLWTQNSTDIAGGIEAGDLFGTSLAAADFNGDGRDDLAIGVPGESVGSTANAGVINVIYSQSGGKLNAAGNRIFEQDDLGVDDAGVDAGNAFGTSLAAGYANNGSYGDLIVSVPGQRVNNRANAGADYTLFGKSSNGWANSINQIWHQNSSGIGGSSESGDLFDGELPAHLRNNQLSVPKLNSDPSAARNLYLDFNGHYQSNGDGELDITTSVFDMDGQNDFFNITELQIIEDIWAHVTEDYAPFGVNVTTVYPDSMTNGVNQRVAFGDKWETWYGNSSSGVAYLNAFTSDLPNVGYVFSQTIFDGAGVGDDIATKLGTSASHEAGHAYGLDHKSDFDTSGTNVDEYSDGTAEWTPIMGGNLNTDRTIWLGAETDLPSSTDTAKGSDDIGVLTDALGERSDDHGQSLSTATSLGTLSQFNNGVITTGIIETLSDIDTFTFSVATAGPLTIQLLTSDVGANLDSRMGFGSVGLYQYGYLAESNPADSLNSSITFNVQTTDYYIDVASVRDMVGDLGQHTLRIDLDVQPMVLIPIVVENSFVSWLDLSTSKSTTLARTTTALKGTALKDEGPTSQLVGGKVATSSTKTTTSTKSTSDRSYAAKARQGVLNRDPIASVDAVFASMATGGMKV